MKIYNSLRQVLVNLLFFAFMGIFYIKLIDIWFLMLYTVVNLLLVNLRIANLQYDLETEVWHTFTTKGRTRGLR